MRNIISSLLTTKSSPAQTYREACTTACQTREGARALANDLRLKAGALGPEAPHEQQALIGRQADTAEHAAQYRALEHDLFERIPAACSRDKEAAMGALKAAEKDAQAAGKLLSVAQERMKGFARSATARRQACEEHSSAAARRLADAEAALAAARDKEDADAMARAAAVVVLARKEVAAVLDRNSAALLEAASFEELAARAQEEYNAAQAGVEDAGRRRNVADMELQALKSDTHMLEALLAHVRWSNANKASRAMKTPGSFSDAAFFFHKLERAPHWDGKSSGGVIGGWLLMGFGGLAGRLAEPDWSAFETEPTVPAGADQQAGE